MKNNNGPRILLYDVETSPNIAYVWGKYEQNVLGDFIKERQIISIAWKWLGEKEVHVLAMPMLKTYKKNPEDNSELIRKFQSVMNQADIVIGHNIDQFDDKMCNVAFIHSDLGPAKPHKTVDTLKVARKYFCFNSNKLDDLGKFLGLGRKVKHWGFAMWVKCLQGDKKAWDLMMEYNKGDVVLLEGIYLKLRPWITRNPRVKDAPSEGCPECKSFDTKKNGRSWRSGRRMVQTYQCLSCGHRFLKDN